MRPRTEPMLRSTPSTRIGGIDLDDPSIPEAIRALQPVKLDVRDDNVVIFLGDWNTGHADDEYDGWGLVCVEGPIPGAWLRQDGTTFLRDLGEGLYAFDAFL